MAGTGNKTFVGAIDNGTTSSRFLIFDQSGTPVASHQIEFKQIHPYSGWHEHDPNGLVDTVKECIDKACEEFESKGYSLSDIKAVGITNQRETTCVWDIRTGEPLHNCIVWTDTRTHRIVHELQHREGADELQNLCGLPLSTYPSSTKLLWLLKHAENVKKVYEEGFLGFGTVDTWLVYKLNGGTKANVHVTDPTNASRTMWMNIHKLEYDDKLISFFGLDVKTPKLHLPKIVPSSDPEAYGKLDSTKLKGTRITGCLGDQSAALVGQCGFTPGRAKNTYGTGCFLLYNVGEKPVISKHGLLATVAYDFSSQGIKPVYALEGSIAVAGSSIKFLMNNLGFFRDAHKVSELARTVPDNGGCVFVTGFSGLFAPYWFDDVQGTIWGLTAYTERGHIARATLEATCFQTKAILDAMEKDAGVKLAELAVDGGMSNSDLCMQIQSDVAQIPVDRPRMRETTALGAAIAAGFAVGVWKSFDELKEINKEERFVFKPKISQRASDKMYNKWNKAVTMSKGWTTEEDDENESEAGDHPDDEVLEQTVTKDEYGRSRDD
ncbi:Glycerol kinase [Exophiala dermatitidis]|uniref:glycerol kinase n=2 Tax=Exophiala dermatitidis TaxID=5970 RepID=H6CAS1_EXODN